jgi:RNA polymerase sigma-70 factor, ECF subfamily
VSAYSYAGGLAGDPEEQSARLALNHGVDRLGDALREMWTTAVRGDGGSRRTRSRPSGDAPPRQLPGKNGANTKPVGGRIGTPVRPQVPPQPTPPPAEQPPQPTRPPTEQPGRTTDTDTAVIPAMSPDTAVIPAVSPDTVVIPRLPADTVIIPAVKDVEGQGEPSGFPDRPDPTDPATEVWNLVERAKAGDTEAFAQIYDRYVDTVFRFVYFRVGNRQLAEDLTSDTFLRALKRIGSFTWQGRDLGAWLVTIARNLVADHFKSGRYRLEITTGDVLDAEREDRGPEGSPEAAVVEHITNVTLLTAVKQLNPEQQECIVLRFLQGFSVAETAKAMGKNDGAIKALQYRAVRALQRLLPEGFQV